MNDRVGSEGAYLRQVVVEYCGATVAHCGGLGERGVGVCVGGCRQVPQAAHREY